MVCQPMKLTFAWSDYQFTQERGIPNGGREIVGTLVPQTCYASFKGLGSLSNKAELHHGSGPFDRGIEWRCAVCTQSWETAWHL